MFSWKKQITGSSSFGMIEINWALNNFILLRIKCIQPERYAHHRNVVICSLQWRVILIENQRGMKDRHRYIYIYIYIRRKNYKIYSFINES